MMTPENWPPDRWNEGATPGNTCSDPPNGVGVFKCTQVISSGKSAESAP